MPHDHSETATQTKTTIPRPYCTIGAGQLTSIVWKIGDQDSGWRYRFNLFRLTRDCAQVSQLYKPSDVRDFVKLAQVLASVILDDGCISRPERELLRQLATDLDGVIAATATASSTEEQFEDCLETCPQCRRDLED